MQSYHFYHYINFQLVNLLSTTRHCTAYWQLSGAHNFDQSPATQISLFYNETFLWHYSAGQQKTTIFFKDVFSLEKPKKHI